MMQDEHFRDEGEAPALTWREVRHFIEAPRRRPLVVVVPCVTVVLLSVAVLFALPEKYRSSTLILIESEKVPESFVAKVATDDRNRRLDAIKPEILSRTRLTRVLDETLPYPTSAGTPAVEKIRQAISVNPSGTDGFTVEFVHTDPYKAQEVASRVATLFIEETMKAREEQVGGAVDFLVTQVEDSRADLEKKDEALRVFKEARMGRLPEQLQTNLATMAMLQREMQTVDENLFFAREKQELLARRLGQPSAAGAGAASGETDGLAELENELAALRARRYTDAHPDVQSLRSRIAQFEERMARTSPGGGRSALDPSVLVNRDQLERATLEVRNLEEKQAQLERRTASVRANIENTPRTEQELATLTRDYEKLNENYAALLSRQLEAQMAGRLEQRWKGDRFRILDPANLPEEPFSPNAAIVLGLGVLLGLFTGLGVAVVAEYLDRTIKDADDLRTVQPFPVLASIPHHPDLGDTSTR